VASPDKSPAYNLKVVLQETNLKADTVRAWERRYGLPAPERSAGGHRLYSDYDIQTIQWLLQRQKEGLRINRAVKLWQSIVESGRDPLEEVPLVEESAPLPIPTSGDTSLEGVRKSWIEACQLFDENRAETILSQAFASYPVEVVVAEVLGEGLSMIGQMWYEGNATVQQEHFASALAVRRLDALIAAAPAPVRKEKFLIACPPGEQHVFAPLTIALFLRRRGWQVVYLGADVPLAELEETVETTRPDLIILSSLQLISAARLAEVARDLAGLKIPIGYGGMIFNHRPGIRQKIPGHFLGETMELAIANAEQLVREKPENPQADPLSENYRETLEAYLDKQPLIDAAMWMVAEKNGTRSFHLDVVVNALSSDVIAALKLGNLDFLDFNIEWVESLLPNRGIPEEVLMEYLSYYKTVLNDQLGENAHLISGWLDRMIEESE
jgi:methanogenic corrinoid protein MtbC1